MGRNVEHALVAAVAAGHPVTGLTLDFLPTERNGQLRTILGEIGFAPTGRNGERELLRFDTASVVELPGWLDVSSGGEPKLPAER